MRTHFIVFVLFWALTACTSDDETQISGGKTSNPHHSRDDGTLVYQNDASYDGTVKVISSATDRTNPKFDYKNNQKSPKDDSH